MRKLTSWKCGIGVPFFIVLFTLNLQAQYNNCNGIRLRYDERFANNSAKCGAPSSVTFRNQTYGGNREQAEYKWYINDSLISSSKGRANIGFSYADTGVYQLKIVARDTVSGCTDSLESEFLVYDQANASIINSADTVCQGSVVYFSPNVTANAWRYTQFAWRDQNGNYTYDTSAAILFPNTGSHRVQLRVRNTSQCDKWVSKYIYVKASNSTLRLNDFNGNPSTTPEWRNCILSAGAGDSFNLILTSPDTVFNYSIDFGDGNSLNGGTDTFYQGKSINHTYLYLGTYTLTIKGEDAYGCKREVRGTVINERIPTAGIIGPPSGNQSGCAPLAVRFINNSYNISNSTTFTWTYGDNQTETFPSTNSGDTLWHTYQKDAADCDLEVTLVAENACGTSVATWAYVNVFDEDDVGLSANNGVICSPDSTITLNVNIDRNCVGGQRYYYWDFGDGRNTGWTTSAAPRSIVYNTPGTYTALIIDSNQCGSDSAIYSVTVRENIATGFNTGFSLGNGNNCAPVTVNTTDTSSGVALTSSWDFGDGVTSTAANPSHTYTTSGDFPITLTKGNECETISATDTIRVYGKPNATIAQIDSTCFPANVSFINQTPHYSSNATFQWTLPDNSTSTAINPPNMTINAAGDYAVTLVVKDSCGSDTITQNFRILGFPNTNFSAPGACEGNVTQFVNSTSLDSNDGNLSSYLWRFGDGQTSSLKNPNHTYASDGNYSVTLIAGSAKGCLDSISKTISVFEQPGLTLNQMATTYCPSSSISFTANIGILGASIDSIHWNFDDGTIKTDSILQIHSFTTAGAYKIGFWTKSNKGCTNTDSLNVTINSNPTLVAKADTVCLGDSSQLVDLSAGLSARFWDFNLDGLFDSGMDTVKTKFNSSGTAKSFLKIISTDGCITTDTIHAYINAQPSALWQTTNDSFCTSDSIVFKNLSTGADTFIWNLNNGAGIFQLNSTTSVGTSYSTSQLQTISLLVKSQFGCSASYTNQIRTIAIPEARFTFPDSIGCAPLNVITSNQSVNASKFNWLGNGTQLATTSYLPTQNITLSSDTLTLQLIANNELGCKPDTFEKDFVTYGLPTAAFTKNKSSGCGPLGISFSNTSTSASSYSWNLGNGNTSNLSSPSTSFQASNTKDSVYYIKLIANSNKGCQDSVLDSIRVYPNPLAQFSLNKSDGCGPLNVQFSNLSSPQDTGSIAIMHFAWNFGNGITSSAQDTQISFASGLLQDSVYTIELSAYSEHNCLDKTSKSVRVYPKPYVDFQASIEKACHPLKSQLLNQSSPRDTGKIDIMQFEWRSTLGNQNSQNLNVQFSNTGIVDSSYQVQLIGISEHGCKDSITKTLTVYPNPIAALGLSDSLFCKLDPITLNNNSTLADTSYFNYGDALKEFKVVGTTAQIKKYKFASRFNVRLGVETRNGCTDADTFQLRILNWPEAAFSSPDTIGCAPMSFSFKNQSRNADSFEWLQNGISISTNDKLADQSISNPNDSSTIQLVASNEIGCHTDTSLRIYRTFKNPQVQFDIDTNSACGDARFQFKNGSSNFSRIIWNFGDGTGSIRNNVAHNFQSSKSQDSQFVVQLTAISKDNCVDSTTDTITLYPIPKVSFTPSVLNGCGPLPVQFKNYSHPKDTGSINIMQFIWNFGNGLSSAQIDGASTFLASKTQDSIYTIKLLGISEHACIDSASQKINVYPNPTANFNLASHTGCSPLHLSFNNTSVPNDTGSIAIMKFKWRSNGTLDSSRHLVDTFFNSNSIQKNYIVDLIAESEHGCKDSTKTTIIVNPLPVAAFQLLQDSTCFSDSFAVSNQSIAGDSFVYNWGDGKQMNTNNLANVKHAYSSTGKFNILLQVYNQYGCSDSLSKAATAINWPKAKIKTSHLAGCAPQSFGYTNQSQNAIAYTWLKDNTVLSTNNSLGSQAIANQKDSLQIQLVAENILGCHSDTVNSLVYTYADPIAVYSMDTSQGCGPLAVSFTNGTAGGNTYQWDFGNGTKSNQTSPTSSFMASLKLDSTYFVKLVATSTNGCLDSTLDSVRVFPLPKAQFAINQNSGCGPLLAEFTNESSPNDTGSIADMHFSWNLGNGKTALSKDTISIYQAHPQKDTVYNIELSAYSEHNCLAKAQQTIRVYPKPLVDFSPSLAASCHPLKSKLTNLSSPKDTGNISIMKFKWYYNGTSSNKQNESVVFNNISLSDSSYSVKLIGTSEHGCVDSISKSLLVYPIPVAKLSLNDSLFCKSDLISIANNSILADTSYYNYGDALKEFKIAGTASQSKKYKFASRFLIHLRVESKHGCQDADTFKVRILNWPEAQFTSTDTIGCAPIEFFYSNKSKNADSFEWLKNGIPIGKTSALSKQGLANPSDSFEIQLVASNRVGCRPDTFSRIYRTFKNPNVLIETDTNLACGDARIKLRNQSTNYHRIVWDFGDGTGDTKNNLKHNYKASQTKDTQFVVQLTAISKDNCVDSTTDTIRLYPNPKVSFTPSVLKGCGPLAVSFTNSSNPYDTSSIADMTFDWNFGNSTLSSQQDPKSTFASSLTQDSIYTVKLTGYSEHGCLDSAKANIRVYPKPSIKFNTINNSGCHPLPIAFTNLSIPNDTGSIAIMKFKWKANGKLDSNRHLIDTFINTNSEPKDYDIKLIGLSEHGCLDSSSSKVTVMPSPTAVFQLTTDSTCHSDSFGIQNQSLTADSFVFHWGDGNRYTTTNKKNKKYAYALAGQFQLLLEAHNKYGCIDSSSKSANAINWPEAKIGTSHAAGCAPQEFSFSNQSLNAVSYSWLSGNTILSNSKTLSKQTITKQEDSLQIQLVAKNALACHSDTARVLTFTYADPKAAFVVDSNQGCGPLNVKFKSNSTKAFIEQWLFSDGGVSIGKNTKHVFDASNKKDSLHQAKLVVTTSMGCKDSTNQSILVFPNPKATFSINNLAGCSPLHVDFGNSSIPNDTGSISIMKFDWDFGNGKTSKTQDAQSTFLASKTRDTNYVIKLKAYSEHGCLDSINKKVSVYPDPSLAISPSVKHGCGPLDVLFLNLSKPNDVSSIFDMSFEWDFGNGIKDSGILGKTVFTQGRFMDTVYKVQLIGKTEHKCADTIFTSIKVHPDPSASFSPSQLSGCSPLKVDFSNHSSPNDTGGLGTMQFIWDIDNGIKTRQQTPQYTYFNFENKDSVFNVELVAMTKWNCRDTLSKQITVHPLPKADFNTNALFGCSPFKLETENLSHLADRQQWFLGNNQIDNSFNLETELKSSVRKDSTFNIKLKTFTNKGCMDSALRKVRVFKQVVAKFEANHNGCTPYDAVFTDQSQNAAIHFWDFGNGFGSNHKSPNHYYTKAGVYDVKLRVVDITGCSDSTEKKKAVSLFKTPDARITLDTFQNELPNAKFTMQPTVWVSDGTVDYLWKSAGQTPAKTALNSYTFNSKGPKDIWLIANTDNCSDSSKEVIDVLLPFPTPGFKSDLRDGCVELEIAFEDTSQWAENVEWFFGDGRASKERNPVHTYRLPGTYKVTQKALNERGQGFITQEDYITVYPKPFVDFDPTPKVVFLPKADVTFNNFSFNAVEYEWFKNDTFFSGDTTPSYRFTERGVYDIKLLATTEHGCKDSVIHDNLVKVRAKGDVNVPTAFTPDGNGINEGFKPIGYGIETDLYHLSIFSRWGEKVFETQDREAEWDGRFKGNMCEPGVYVWVLKLKFAHGEIRTEQGNVTLIR